MGWFKNPRSRDRGQITNVQGDGNEVVAKLKYGAWGKDYPVSSSVKGYFSLVGVNEEFTGDGSEWTDWILGAMMFMIGGLYC